MKILFISYDFPFPPTGGSISRDYNLIKQISKQHELYMVNRTIRGEIKQEYIEEMKKYVSQLKVVPWNYDHTSSGFLKSIFSKTPYIIKRFESQEMQNIISEIISNNKFDLIFCDHIYLAQYIPEEIVNKIPVIPNNEDCGFTYYKRMSKNSGLLRKIYAGMEWKKMLNYEIEILKKYKVYITTSQKEKELITGYYNEANICVIENGVDTEYFKKSERTDFSPGIVFTAWFKYYPNAQAAIYFVNEIFPLVKKKFPDLKFYIVGKEPPEAVKALEKNEGVIVTGYVEDVRQYLNNADISVIPLQIGGGTRLKILESMSMEIPVVSTELGAEGLDVIGGKNILIAENEVDFSEKIIHLLENKKAGMCIGKNGRNLVEEKYDWQKIGNKLNNFLNEYVKNYNYKWHTIC